MPGHFLLIEFASSLFHYSPPFHFDHGHGIKVGEMADREATVLMESLLLTEYFKDIKEG